MNTFKLALKVTAYATMSALLTIALGVALLGRLFMIIAAIMFVAFQEPTQVDTTELDAEPVATTPASIAPTATPILSIVPDSKPITALRKEELRAACRTQGIKYGKMNLAQMRQALQAVSA